MKLNGIEYKGGKVTIMRPEKFPKSADSQEISAKINLHEVSLASLVEVVPSHHRGALVVAAQARLHIGQPVSQAFKVGGRAPDDGYAAESQLVLPVGDIGWKPDDVKVIYRCLRAWARWSIVGAKQSHPQVFFFGLAGW